MGTPTEGMKHSAEIDWSKFGLDKGSTDPYLHGNINADHSELFHEDQSSTSHKPWFKSNFFLSEPVLFGTWDGVFTSCMINLFGVIIFLRGGWIVGNAGIVYSLTIVLTTVIICFVAVMAGIGICERCHIQSGGIHFLVSHVLGSQIGGAVSIVYCIGQAVNCALHVMGFAESMSQLLRITDPWLERALATGAILLLMGINIAGVKWVIRVQFLLLMTLLLAALDFAVGTFVRTNAEAGVVGYDLSILQNNTMPDYTEGENWFTVFGVFFPAMTGIFAGVNMSGDLRNPSKDIPVGTLTAVGVSLFLYFVFVVGLGATCERWALKSDYLITEKVSAVGVFLFCGLYVSSMSSCLGALYATPRIIQSIAQEKIVPVAGFLARGKGANKVPVYALILFALVTLIFILIGRINTLAPIVTIPFLLTYACVEYAYFSLAMTFDIQRKKEQLCQTSATFDPAQHKSTHYGTTSSTTTKVNELDELFPERLRHVKKVVTRHDESPGSTDSLVTSPDEHSSIHSAEDSAAKSRIDDAASDETSTVLHKRGDDRQPEVCKKSSSWYSLCCNRWIVLLGAVVKLVVIFLVQWGYALSFLMTMAIIWLYIYQISPGSSPGITQFKLFPWIETTFLKCIGYHPSDYDRVVVASEYPGVEVTSAQLTEDNTDYAARDRYHRSTAVKTPTGTSHPQHHHFQEFDSD